MTVHGKLIVTLKLFVIAASIFALAGMVGAATPVNQIVIHNQEIHQGILMVDAVTAEQDGWIVIYKRGDLTSDMIVGYAAVAKGFNANVRVTIDESRLDNVQVLWAVLHVNKAPLSVFEWGTNGRAYNDPPVPGVIVAFGKTGDSAPMSLQGAMTIKNQETNNGLITLDLVVTPVDGWVAIYKGPVFNAAAIAGYAPVYQGRNVNVPVSVNADQVNKETKLSAILLVDGGTHGVFEYGRFGRALADVPLIQNGAPVIAVFGTH